MSKAVKKSTSKPSPEAPSKMIPAPVVIDNVQKQLTEIDSHIEAVDLLLGLVEGASTVELAAEAAGGLSIMLQGIQNEIDRLHAYLGRMVISGKDGSALGIEEGGAQ